MKRLVLALCALSLMVALVGCQSTANGVALQVTPDNPQVFRVGPDVYTLADYTLFLKEYIDGFIQQGATPEQIQQYVEQNNIRASIFDFMVQNALLMQYARNHGIGADAAALDASVLSQVPALDKPFFSFTDLRRSQAVSQVVFTVIAQNTRIDMYHARHIMLEDEASADQILADLKGGADFATLAAARSKDPGLAADGGDLGWQPRGSFVAEFEDAGFNAALNTPIKIQTSFGWHVLEVLERESNRAFDTDQLQALLGRLQSSNPEAAQAFLDANFTPWYDQLRQDALASKDLVLAEGFDPNSVPLTFPEP